MPLSFCTLRSISEGVCVFAGESSILLSKGKLKFLLIA